MRRATHGLDDDGIQDACAFAWLTLVRRPDIRLDGGGYQWLFVAATHEARRAYRAARDLKADPLLDADADVDELHDPFAHDRDPLERALDAELHHERRQRFASLSPAMRRDALLHAAGYRYPEIAELTGTSRTAVNHHLVKGRARLRATP